MRRIVCSLLVVVALASVGAAPVAADSAAWRDRQLDCGDAGSIRFVLPPSEFMTAFVPLHEQDGTRILTIRSITVNGETYVSKPLAANAAARVVTCGYVDPQGLAISIVGLLTPGR